MRHPKHGNASALQPTEREATDARKRPRKKWVFPMIAAIAAFVIFAGVSVFLYPQAASWFAQKEQSSVTEQGLEALTEPPNSDPEHREAALVKAREYNADLTSGAIMPANASIPVGEGISEDGGLEYDDLLSISDEGVMGRIMYKKLGIDLPIYHGTGDDTLKRGVGHLEGTSLPVGGENTRSVLTAHRGLPEATLFNELDRAAVGDTLTISVLGEVLTYQVVETQVIKPEDTQAVLPEEGRDLISLITCTPIGVNSHRIFVTAERVTPTPPADIDAARATPEIPGFPWWVLILGATLAAATWYVWKSGYTEAEVRQRRAERARARAEAESSSEATETVVTR